VGESRTHWPVGTPALMIAVGGALAVVRLPLLGAAGVLLGGVLAVVGLTLLRGRVTDERARRAATLALGAGITGLGAPWVAAVTTVGPAAWAAVGVAAGTLALGGAAVAGALEEGARAHPDLAADWWTVVTAVVVVHGPIAVATVLSATVDGTIPSVSGAAALGVTTALLAPLGLLARAGWRSDVAPHRGRDRGDPPRGAAEAASREGPSLSAS
jgi:hypothetical protein